MKFSALQKYILKECIYAKQEAIDKTRLLAFYKGSKTPSMKDKITIITKSVDRLIKKELLIGYGWKTPHRWYITQVKLTPKGRAESKKLFGIQQKLPLKK